MTRPRSSSDSAFPRAGRRRRAPAVGRAPAVAALVFAASLAGAGAAVSPAARAQPAQAGETAAAGEVAEAGDIAQTAPTEAQRCLALSMYWEARGEGAEGMRAVGSVVLNRIGNEDFPDTPCEVVYQGGETPPCQFSWWCDGRSDVPREAEEWRRALSMAAAMLADRGDDPTRGALYFHHAALDVPWRIERERTVRIGHHVYYR